MMLVILPWLEQILELCIYICYHNPTFSKTFTRLFTFLKSLYKSTCTVYLFKTQVQICTVIFSSENILKGFKLFICNLKFQKLSHALKKVPSISIWILKIRNFVLDSKTIWAIPAISYETHCSTLSNLQSHHLNWRL